jgi:hypothetical protein
MEHLEARAPRDDVLQHGLGGATDDKAYDTGERRHDGTYLFIGHAVTDDLNEPERCFARLADDLHSLSVETMQGQVFEAATPSKKRNDRHSRQKRYVHQHFKRITGIGGKGLHGLFCESVAIEQSELAEGTAPA